MPNRIILPEAELRRLYQEKYYSYKDLAKYFGVAQSTIGVNLHRYKIPPRPAVGSRKLHQDDVPSGASSYTVAPFSPEHRAKISQAKKGKSFPQISAALKGRPSPLKGRKLPEEVKRKVSASLKNYFQEHGVTQTAREKISRITRERWSNPDWARKMLKRFNSKPNSLEKKLGQMLDEAMPGTWKYVGDGQVIIGGKCPDFINVNGKKKLIELYGAYWHDIFDIARRVEFFRQYGFDTLIVWDEELKDESRLKSKIIKFNRRKS